MPVTSIGIAFNGYENLKSVIISDNITSIEPIAFSGCFSLESVLIPNSVKSIESLAFKYCGLKSITIPESVESIGVMAFDQSVLDEIIIKNPECVIYDSILTINNGSQSDKGTFFNGTIYGYENSTAQAYAEKYGYNFKAIN